MGKIGCVKEGDPIWGSPVEIERRNRIRLSVAAYAYEYKDDSIMSDAEFDALSYKIDVSVSTKNRKMDNFFKKNFEPCTGMWIRKHPDKRGLENIYHRYFKKDEA
ncbi:hypothetical protein KNU84_gp074 [Bacteriophage DSS3_VP1]|uniref:Uncharacterized protein n=1 Tax=Bacteriophage DSS3_VP1 TaxID=2664196 RepID=A0A7S5KQ85_9CAUD|nr:hypothetical protein KNU84_gp074 [Bacteriophage DSS3_VP1]QGH74630.1 hypothetical protein DSS3VP1_00062 [Bacteriophage DSS3_VP1]